MKRRTLFIWYHGVLVWGLGTGVVTAIVLAFLYEERAGFKAQLVFGLKILPLWAVGGYLWGYAMWSLLIRRGDRSRESGDSEEPKARH